jgi:hypothetical protein
MIELNPLVIEHHPIKTPRDAPADEFLDCVWQELTDKIHYLPGGLVKGKVSYKACFHDLPMGLQTHIYAPTGLDIREKWSIGGSLPGEPPEPRELGIDLPATGLYLREDCDMRCNRFLAGFVRKNLDNAHKTLIERILKKAQLIERHREGMTPATAHPSHFNAQFQPGSHMATSRIPMSPTLDRQNMLSPQNAPNLADHPAFRNNHNRSWSSSNTQTNNSMASQMQNGRQSYQQVPQTKQFISELPGDSEYLKPMPTPNIDSRQSMISELTGSDFGQAGSQGNASDRGSMISAETNQPAGYHRYNPQEYSNFAQRQEDARVELDSQRVSELPAGAGQQLPR